MSDDIFSAMPQAAGPSTVAPTAPTADSGDIFSSMPGAPPPDKPLRSYLGASAVSGLQSTGALASEAVGSLTAPTSKRDLITLYKDDPEKFQQQWGGLAYAPLRMAEDLQRRAVETMDPANLTPRGQEIAEREYFTLDPAKSVATAGPTRTLERVAGDVLQSQSTALGIGATVAGARLAGPRGAMVAGGTAGGLLEGGGQYLQVRQALEEAPLQAYEKIPRFKELIAEGYRPQMARLAVIEEASSAAGLQSGMAATVIDGLGGRIFGNIVERPAPVLGRFARAGALEAGTEGTQGAEQQVTQNQALQTTIKPDQNIFEGVGEAATSGAIVGGLLGGGGAAVGGRSPVATPARPSAEGVVPPEAPPGGPSGSVDNNVGNIINKDGTGFLTAPTPEVGVAMTVRNVQAYPGKYNGGAPMTLRQIAYKWAPPDDGKTPMLKGNNPDAWAKVVADSMGLSPDEPVNMADPAMAEAFAKGVHRIEKGAGKLFPDEVYRQGASIGLSGAPLPTMAADPVLGSMKLAAGMQVPDTALDADLDLFVDEAAATQGEDQIRKQTEARDVPETVEGTSEPLGGPGIPGAAQAVPPRVGQAAQVDPTAATVSARVANSQQLEDAERLNQIWRDYQAQRLAGNTPLEQVVQRLAKEPGVNLTRLDLDRLNDEVKAVQQYASNDNERQTALDEVANSFAETFGQREGEYGRAQFGRSDTAAQTLRVTPNPNNSISLANLPVAESLRPAQIGQRVREIALRPGEVIGVGVPTEHYPVEFFRDTVSTVRELIAQFAPRARVLVTPMTRGLAGVQSFMRRLDPKANFYVINPRNMTRIDQVKGNAYNFTTRAQFMYGLVHEVGHVMVEEHFLGDLPEDVQTSLRKVGQTDPFELIPESLIKELPPERAAIAREFNEKKQRLLGPDSKATFGQWLTEMGSPSVLVQGAGQLKEVTARAFSDMYFNNKAWDEPARKWVGRWHEDGWPAGSLHEYLSDQLARYAHNKSLLRNTTLGKSQWFKDLWTTLKEMFRSLKEAGFVPKVAGEKAFERWVKSLASKPTNQGKGQYQKVPLGRPGEIRTDSNMLPEASSVEAIETAIQVRNLPGVSEDARGEALEMLARGQVEAAKELAEESIAGPTIIRWASNGPAYTGLQQQIDQLARLKGKPWEGLRPWLASGWRKLAEAMDFAVNIREFAFRDPTNTAAQLINLRLTQYKAYMNGLEQRAATNVIDLLAKQPGKQQRRIFDLLQKEWEGGQHWTLLVAGPDGNFRHQATPRLAQEAQAAGLVPQSVEAFLAIKNEYLFRQQELHRIMRAQLQAKLDEALAAGRGQVATFHLRQIRDLGIAMRNVRNVPFSPMTRFGQYTLTVRSAQGQVKHVEAYESQDQRARARERLAKAQAAGHPDLIGAKFIEAPDDTTSSILRVLPLENLAMTSAAFGLTPRQVANLRARIDPVTANPLTRKYSIPLGKISGHSRDQLRTFADFMHHDSLVLSKLLFRDQFREGLRLVDQDIQAANDAGDSAAVARFEHARSYLSKSVKQILNPAHEYHLLRSVVVLKQLAFSVKTALVNFSSLVNTWAIATTRIGTLRGTVEVNKAAKDAAIDVLNRTQQQLIGRVLHGPADLSVDDRRAITVALEHGLLNETLAADMAHLANGNLIDRFNLPRTVGLQESMAKWWRGTLRVGMLPQRVVEEIARQTTFLSMFRIYRKQGLDFNAAYNAAKTDTEMTQGDNSIQARAPMLRGEWKSAVLIYYNFMRNMLLQMTGGYERGRRRREALGELPRSNTNAWWMGETVRMWLVYAFLGGLMGLPGAEDLDALAELVAKQLFGTRFSLKEKAYELAGWIADNAHDIGLDINPRSIVRGGMSDVFGFDLSGSLSLGSAVPGAGGIDRLGEDGEKFLTETLGPAGRELQNILDAFNPTLPWERRLAFFIPTFAQNLLKGVESEPRFFTGARIAVDPATGAVRMLTTGEQIGQMMGFIPSIVSANKEVTFLQNDTRKYWVERRNGLTAALFEAKITKEADAVHEAMAAIGEFNRLAPPGMAITADSIRRSIQSRAQRVRQQEVGSTPQRMLQSEFGRVRQLVVGAPTDGEGR